VPSVSHWYLQESDVNMGTSILIGSVAGPGAISLISAPSKGKSGHCPTRLRMAGKRCRTEVVHQRRLTNNHRLRRHIDLDLHEAASSHEGGSTHGGAAVDTFDLRCAGERQQ